MANFLYDLDTDTWYATTDNVSGWIILFAVIAIPFGIIAFFLQDFSLFVHDHMVLSCLIFLALSYLLGRFLYRTREALHPKAGSIAVLVSLLPCGLAQLSALSKFWENENLFGALLNWLILTFLTVSVTVFVIQLSLLSKDGLKHLVIASCYLALAVVMFLLF